MPIEGWALDVWAPVVGCVLALLCLYAAFRTGRKGRLVADLPTSKTTGVFIGLVEVKGAAECASPLSTYLSAQQCVFHEWRVEERWSRTVTRTVRDSKGRTSTRTRRESGWKTVARGGGAVPFYLRDDCGVILIRPEGARTEPVEVFRQTCGRSNPLYYAKGPSSAVANSDHRRRFVEKAIPLGQELYVMGQARERKDIVAPEIARDPQAPMFLISTRTEEQIKKGKAWAVWCWRVLGLLLCAGGFALREHARDPSASADWRGVLGAMGPLTAACALGFVAAAGLAWVWMAYNSLVELRRRVWQAWSLIDIQLKRRHDLIPRIVSATQGYAAHERALQAELAELRSQADATAPDEKGPDVHAVAPIARVCAERYPQLKADESFLSLQKTLVDTEHRIALAREYFNTIATRFNIRLDTFPDMVLGRLAGMKPKPMMEAHGLEREAVSVDFVPQDDAAPADSAPEKMQKEEG